MTSIDKATIPISKAALVMVFVGGLIVHYFTTLNAVRQGISDLKYEMQLEVQALKNEDFLLRTELSNKVTSKDVQLQIMSFIGEGLKPEEPSASQTENKKRRK